MEFRDLKHQYKVLKGDIDNAMFEVAASSAYIMGTPVKALEAELSEYVGAKHCLTCGNGTDALTLALMAWGIGPGDAVFVPDFTFFSSSEVVSFVGATPVFVDVCEETFNIDSSDLEKKIEEVKRDGKFVPKVIIAVDLFGLPANYPELRNIADKFGLLILEDGAQGFGGSINGKRSCSFGDISTTSFFPAKPLGCYGDGGALFTDNDEWAGLLESLRVHGKGTFKYDNVRIGMNSRLDTIQAAILSVKLDAFKKYELDAVNEVAYKYGERLSGVIKTPVVPEGFYSSWAQYTIRLNSKEQRDKLQTSLKEAGIPSMVYYPVPMHSQAVYRESDYNKGDCPVSSKLCDTVLSLPMHPYLKTDEIDMISMTIKNILR